MTAPPALPLHTARLLLRTARADDVDDVIAYCGDPEVTRYLPHDTLDREAVEARLERFAAGVAPVVVDDVLWLMLEVDDTVIGHLMLRLKDGDPPSVAEVGWVVHPSYAGRGLATEGARAVVDLAFAHYGMHRVVAQLDARNDASARLCERLGMTREAHLRQDWWSKGEWTDTVVYGLLREEWSARP